MCYGLRRMCLCVSVCLFSCIYTDVLAFHTETGKTGGLWGAEVGGGAQREESDFPLYTLLYHLHL